MTNYKSKDGIISITHMGYTSESIKGAGWTGGLRGITRVISVFRAIILARILSPSQFGVFGIAILVTSLLEVFTETGVNVLLIQEKDRIEKYLNSAWIVSIIRGLLIAVVIFLSASFVSSFFSYPQALIMIQLISLVPLIKGFINPASIRFQKYLEFHKEFWYRFVIFSFDATVAILFALLTKSAISLVIGLIAGAMLESLMSFLIIKPIPTLSFNKKYLFKIFNRGKWITFSGIFNYLYHNLDNIVVGKVLGVSSLGLYEMAYRISLLPITEVADAIQKVTFPVFTKISDDRDRLKKAYIKSLVAVSLLSIPFGIIIFIFSKEIVLVLLGSNWEPIIPVLRILAVFGVLRAISGSSSSLFLSVGKQEYVTVITLVSMISLAITVIPLVNKFGIYGAGISALFGSIVALPFMYYYIIKIFKDSYYEKS